MRLFCIRINELHIVAQRRNVMNLLLSDNKKRNKEGTHGERRIVRSSRKPQIQSKNKKLI